MIDERQSMIPPASPQVILQEVAATIKDRRTNPKPGSYTNSLFDTGLDEITKKVGEEAIEVIIAAQHQGNERLISELADLTYHCLVLMVQMGVTLDEVAAELTRRHLPRPDRE